MNQRSGKLNSVFQAKEKQKQAAAAQTSTVTSPSPASDKPEKCEKNYSTCCFSHVCSSFRVGCNVGERNANEIIL